MTEEEQQEQEYVLILTCRLKHKSNLVVMYLCLPSKRSPIEYDNLETRRTSNLRWGVGKVGREKNSESRVCESVVESCQLSPRLEWTLELLLTSGDF